MYREPTRPKTVSCLHVWKYRAPESEGLFGWYCVKCDKPADHAEDYLLALGMLLRAE